MASATQRATTRHFLLENISWETYERLLREVDSRHVRLTYDNGDLEIMTLSLGHESSGRLLGTFVRLVALELDMPLKGGGSTTMRQRLKKKGLEPDECFWFEHERAMRGKEKWRAGKDPPPDLAIEMDITHSSLNRMAIYAALRVGEVWPCTRKALLAYRFGGDGSYHAVAASALLPFLPLDRVFEFVKMSEEVNETTLLKRFTAWLRAEVVPAYEAWRKHGDGSR
jgi:Uma2 family endonuclease